MLFTSDLTPDSIEKNVCAAFEKQLIHCPPMEPKLTEFFIQLFLLPKDMFQSMSPSSIPWTVELIKKRLEHVMTFKINDDRLLLLLCYIAETPGSIIMYLWYLQYCCFKTKKQELDLDTFSYIFGKGFLTQQQLSEIWDSQKVQTETMTVNLVDYVSAGQSILNLKEETHAI